MLQLDAHSTTILSWNFSCQDDQCPGINYWKTQWTLSYSLSRIPLAPVIHYFFVLLLLWLVSALCRLYSNCLFDFLEYKFHGDRAYGRQNDLPMKYLSPYPQNLWKCYHTWQKGLCRCDQGSCIRWVILNYVGRPNVIITRVLINGRGRQAGQREIWGRYTIGFEDGR